MPESLGDVLDVTYNWVTRVLVVSVATLMVETDNTSRILNFWILPIDNPEFNAVYSTVVLSDNTVISTTIAPFTG